MGKIKVTSGLSMSLDGFGAGVNQSFEKPFGALEPIEVSGTKMVTHIRYNVF